MKDYFRLRRNATILRDNGGYSLGASEMNPVIFEEFVEMMMDRGKLPIVWEPFAGRTNHSLFQDYANDNGVTLISQTLNPVDGRIHRGDSVESGPPYKIGGMIFHPPYFGSVPVSSDQRDVCMSGEKSDYLHRLRIVIHRAREKMASGGLVCAIGRDYRMNGERIRLDLWYLDIFRGEGFSLDSVWISEPDVIMIFRKQ